MSYVWHEEDIVHRHGVELVGWPCDDFVNPSELSSSVAVLTRVRDALTGGECKWVKLQPDVLRARIKKYNADVAAGRIVPKERAQRSDKGRKRKRPQPTQAGDDSDDPEERGDDDDDVDGAATTTTDTGPTTATTDATTTPTDAGPITATPDATAIGDNASSASGMAEPPAKRRKKVPAPKKAKKSKKDKENEGEAPKARPKPKPRTKAPRDDEITRKVIAEQRAARFKSRAIITSDDDADDSTAAGPSGGMEGTSGSATAATDNVIDPALLT